MNELLEKVGHDLGFAHSGLLDALAKAGAVEARAIVPLIRTLATLRGDIESLQHAVVADATKGRPE